MAVNPRPAFMAELKNLCRSVDTRVGDLERETRVAVLAPKGPYASNAADELREECLSLSRDIDNSLAVVTEERSNMASFLDEMKVQFGEIVQDTIKCEEFMAQYGYKSKTNVNNIEELLNWDAPVEETPAAAGEFDELDNNKENTEERVPLEEFPEQDEEVSKLKSKTPIVVKPKPAPKGSPDFFEVGLSDLAMELYAGKSIRSCKPRPKTDNRDPSPRNIPSSKSDAQQPPGFLNPQHITATDYLQDDSMYNASPVLRLSSKLAKQSDLSSNMSNVSNIDSVDITPGLPSRKKPKSTVSTTNLPTTSSFDQDDTPVMPELQTVNFAKFNWQQMSSASPELPTVHPHSKPLVQSGRSTAPGQIVNGTPELPELQTIDVRQLVLDSKPMRRVTPTEPSFASKKLLSKVEREDTPEEPQLSGHYNYNNTKPANDTPEMPDLQTIDVRKLVLEPKPMRRVTPTEPSLLTKSLLSKGNKNTPEEPQLMGGYLKQSSLVNQLENTTPEEPQLSGQYQQALRMPKMNTSELPEVKNKKSEFQRSKSPDTPVLSYKF